MALATRGRGGTAIASQTLNSIVLFVAVFAVIGFSLAIGGVMFLAQQDAGAGTLFLAGMIFLLLLLFTLLAGSVVAALLGLIVVPATVSAKTDAIVAGAVGGAVGHASMVIVLAVTLALGAAILAPAEEAPAGSSAAGPSQAESTIDVSRVWGLLVGLFPAAIAGGASAALGWKLRDRLSAVPRAVPPATATLPNEAQLVAATSEPTPAMPPPPGEAYSSMRPSGLSMTGYDKKVVGLGVLMILGTLLPWSVFQSDQGEVAIMGLNLSAGPLVLGLAVVVIFVWLRRHPQRQLASLLCATVASLLSFLDFVRVATHADLSIGLGLYVALLSSIALLAFLLSRDRERLGASPQKQGS